MNATSNLNYEIEFLRAISVILVLLFHFEIFIFSGWIYWSRCIFCYKWLSNYEYYS